MAVESAISIFAVIYYSVQFVLGTPGNLLIIMVYHRKKRKISTDILIIAQAVIDLIASLLAPINILRSVSHQLTVTAVCRIALFGNNSMAFSSLFLTAAIAFDRYFYVCRPLGKKTSNRQAFFLAVICCVLGCSLTCTKLIYVEPQLSPSGEKICLVIDTVNVLDTLEAWLKTTGFVFALVVCTVMYGKIYHTIRKQAKIHAMLVGGNSVSRPKNATSAYPPTHLASATDDHSHDDHTVHGVNDAGHVKLNIAQTDNAHNNGHHDHADCSPPPTHLSSASCYLVEQTAQTNASVTHQDPAVPHPDHQHQQHHGDVANGNGTAAASSATGPNNTNNSNGHPVVNTTVPGPKPRFHQRGENRTTKMLMAVTVILLASWLPPIVFFHLRDSTLEIIEVSVTAETLVYIGRILPGFNHVLNYFVYLAMNKRFRVDCKRLFVK